MNKKITTLVLILIIISASVITVFNLRSRYNQKQNTIISTVSIKLSPDEIVNQSDGVIIGTVKDLKTTKAPSDFRQGEEDIVTNAVISVEEYLFNPKGLSSSDITVQTVGGTIGDESMAMEDAPVFEKGQRVIVFLKQSKNDVFVVFGDFQGKYVIDNDNVGRGAQEQAIFESIFGKQMTFDEFKKSINSFVSTSTSKE